MNKLQEIKLLSDCLKTISRYKDIPPPGCMSGFVTPESISVKRKEKKLINKLIKELVELRGYIIFETVTFKKVPEYVDTCGVRKILKFTRHRIKATSYKDALRIIDTKFKKENKTGRIRIVG